MGLASELVSEVGMVWSEARGVAEPAQRVDVVQCKRGMRQTGDICWTYDTNESI